MFYTLHIVYCITAAIRVFYAATRFLLYIVHTFCAVLISVVINSGHLTCRNLVSLKLSQNSYTCTIHLPNNHLTNTILFLIDLYYASPNKTHLYINTFFLTLTIHSVTIFIFLTMRCVLQCISNTKRAIVIYYIHSKLSFHKTINYESTIITFTLGFLFRVMTFILLNFQLNE